MGYMTKQEYEDALYKIRRKNQQKRRKQKLKAEKMKYKHKKKLPSTSKLILIGAVLLCLEIIIFCEYLMWKTSDLTAMYVLIGIAASMASIVLGYFVKAKAENTQGGLKFESAMEELRQLGRTNENIPSEDNEESLG